MHARRGRFRCAIERRLRQSHRRLHDRKRASSWTTITRRRQPFQSRPVDAKVGGDHLRRMLKRDRRGLPLEDDPILDRRARTLRRHRPSDGGVSRRARQAAVCNIRRHDAHGLRERRQRVVRDEEMRRCIGDCAVAAHVRHPQHGARGRRLARRRDRRARLRSEWRKEIGEDDEREHATQL